MKLTLTELQAGLRAKINAMGEDFAVHARECLARLETEQQLVDEAVGRLRAHGYTVIEPGAPVPAAGAVVDAALASS